MSDGWIKLHRQLMDHDLWTQEPFTRGQAWVDLLMLANHASAQFRVRGNLVLVSRGEVARSEDSLAQRWHWSRNKVRRFIAELSEKTIQQIEQQKSPILSKIRIINYDLYQSNEPSGTTDDTTERQQKDTNKNDNKKKNDKNEENNTLSVEFDRFWEVYPKKVGKAHAFTAWKKAKGKPSIDKIIQAVSIQAESTQWQKNGGQYIPNPATWLNQGRWDDKPTEVVDPQSWAGIERKLLQGATSGQDHVIIGRDR